MQSVKIKGKPVDASEDAWQTFASQNDAAQILTDLLGCLSYQKSIINVVLGVNEVNEWMAISTCLKCNAHIYTTPQLSKLSTCTNLLLCRPCASK